MFQDLFQWNKYFTNKSPDQIYEFLSGLVGFGNLRLRRSKVTPQHNWLGISADRDLHPSKISKSQHFWASDLSLSPNLAFCFLRRVSKTNYLNEAPHVPRWAEKDIYSIFWAIRRPGSSKLVNQCQSRLTRTGTGLTSADCQSINRVKKFNCRQ